MLTVVYEQLQQGYCMNMKTITGCLFIIIIAISIPAELVKYNEEIIYDTHAAQYWYQPLFYGSGMDGRTYDAFAARVNDMNIDPALTSDKWGDWYVAKHSDITRLLKNDLMKFSLFEASDGSSLSLDYDRFYNKKLKSRPEFTGSLNITIPDIRAQEEFPEYEMPDPKYYIEFSENDKTSGGSGAGFMGIWVTAQGSEKHSVPEPQTVAYILSGYAGILLFTRKVRHSSRVH
jgi:hypothetical protein